MKIAHFSDLHYCGKNIDESDRCFGAAIEAAIESDAEVGVISGDLIDHRLSANDIALHALIKRVKRLAYSMPVFILQGTYSHDALGTLNLFRFLKTFNPIHVSNDEHDQVWLFKGATLSKCPFVWAECGSPQANEMIDDPMWSQEALFSGLPPYNKAQAAAINAKDVDQVTAMEIGSILTMLSALNIHAKAEKIPTIMVSHGTIVGSITEHGVPMAGSDHEFSPELLATAKADIVMLGHIHKHQIWNHGTTTIAYPGSIGRFHQGEVGTKGWLLWDTDNTSDPVLMPTPASHSFAIDLDAPPIISHLEELRDNWEHPQGITSVRVRYRVDEEHRNHVYHEEIRQVFDEFMHVKIEPIINPIERTRAAGFNELVTVGEKIHGWGSVTDTDVAGALQCYDDLITHTAIEKVVEASLGS